MTKPFKLWDSQALQDSLKTALQIKAQVEDICATNKVSPYQLPYSVVPTADLFDMAACYVAMYDKLLEQSLLLTGNLKANRNNIH